MSVTWLSGDYCPMTSNQKNPIMHLLIVCARVFNKIIAYKTAYYILIKENSGVPLLEVVRAYI